MKKSALALVTCLILALGCSTFNLPVQQDQSRDEGPSSSARSYGGLPAPPVEIAATWLFDRYDQALEFEDIGTASAWFFTYESVVADGVIHLSEIIALESAIDSAGWMSCEGSTASSDSGENISIQCRRGADHLIAIISKFPSGPETTLMVISTASN